MINTNLCCMYCIHRAWCAEINTKVKPCEPDEEEDLECEFFI
jgi:hypothetical protein